MYQFFERCYGKLRYFLKIPAILALIFFLNGFLVNKFLITPLQSIFPYFNLLFGVCSFCGLTYCLAEGFPKTRRSFLNISAFLILLVTGYFIRNIFESPLSLVYLNILPLMVVVGISANFLIFYNTRISFRNLVSKNIKLLSNILQNSHLKKVCFSTYRLPNYNEEMEHQTGDLSLDGTHVYVNLDQVLSAEDIFMLSQKIQSPNIIGIIFKTNHINAENAEDLIRMLEGSNIALIEMNSYDLGDRGVKHLFHRLPETKISSLHLRSCNISDKGLNDLMSRFKETSVRELDLNGNHITLDGIKSIVPTIKNTSLTNLSVTSQYTKPKLIHKIMDYIISFDSKSFPFWGEHQVLNNHNLDQALTKNKERIKRVPPLLFLSMNGNRRDVVDYHKKYAHCKNASEELLFVWGILQGVPLEIRKYIVDLANKEMSFNSEKALAHFLRKRPLLQFQPKEERNNKEDNVMEEGEKELIHIKI